MHGGVRLESWRGGWKDSEEGAASWSLETLRMYGPATALGRTAAHNTSRCVVLTLVLAKWRGGGADMGVVFS